MIALLYTRSPHFPISTDTLTLDIGAGSGRDSAWFATRGDDVFAVEPSDAVRNHARALHPSPCIDWLFDSLPEPTQVRRLGLTLDFILHSGAGSR